MSAPPLKPGRALITGASAGIGEAFAHEFARHGYNLTLVARREHKLQALAAELKKTYAIDVSTCACDLLDPSSIERIRKTCSDQEIDILVNNAGVMYHGDFKEQQLESIDSIVHLNVACLTKLSSVFLQPMLRRGGGRILNITSTTGFQAGPTIAVYAASKAYILSFTEALAEELRDSGVYATAFCPGFTDTHMAAESFGEDIKNEPMSAFLMMSTTDVAALGYQACMQGTTISVPGFANKLVSGITRLQPKWMSRRLQAWMYRNMLGGAEKN
ncbi:SDR family NAD(P)-dependent oxidoreductase [Candidatus Litorirhabdus singularis]|uniref:SDR family NAD(P)-dependent oxidoreductase n=1 Tax=Candidatus Litorirhabdus singularis TaxID=2518993 RepID=UPI00242DB984|nr:SDR family oxidoreductase [Candidatus Litorirhabdus singularis]